VQPPQQWTAPYYQAPRRAVPKKPVAAAVIAIVGVVVLCISFASPWYDLKLDMSVSSGYGLSGSYKVDSKSDFGGVKTSVSTSMFGMGMSATCSTSWDSAQMKNTTATKGVFKTTQALDVAAIAGTALLLVGSVVMVVRPGQKKIALVLGLVAIVLCMIGPAYFAGSLPAAQKTDQENSMDLVAGITGSGNSISGDGPWNSFFGQRSIPVNSSETSASMNMSWGPDSGWYLAWAGLAMAAVAFALVLTSKPPMPQQPGPQPQYPMQPYPGMPAQPGPGQFPQAPPPQYPQGPGYPPAQQQGAFEYVAPALQPAYSSPPQPPQPFQPAPPAQAPYAPPGQPPQPPYQP